MSEKLGLIAEALLDGADRDGVRARLLAAGVTPAMADYEMKRADKNPLFAAAQTLNRRLAKRDWVLGIHSRLSRTRPGGLSIPIIDRIDSIRFYADFYAANRPVKLTGLIDHWPALERWTLDYLADRVGGAMVELQAQRGSAADYEVVKDRHRRVLPMRMIVDAIRDQGATNEFYVTAYNDSTNKQSLAPLWDDIGDVSILRPSGDRDGFFWLGPQGTLTPFHHDLTNNLLVQVMGRKRVLMVPSWEVGRMRNRLHCFSDLGPSDIAGADAPGMIDCTIGAGEALFLPIGWWHHVEALDASISMSFTNFAADNDFHLDYPADTRF